MSPPRGSRAKPITCPYCGGVYYGRSPFRRHLPDCAPYRGERKP